MALPGAYNEQGIYGSGKGEGVKLRSEAPNPNIAIATAQQQKQNEIEKTPEKMVAAWDVDYFPLLDDLSAKKKEYATMVAEGKMSPQKAEIAYKNYAGEVVSLGKVTQQQEKDWNGIAEVYAKDDKGLYNTTQGYLFMDIYKSPERHFNDPELGPILKEQMASVGGNQVMWRAKYGTKYLQPQLAYDHEKMVNDQFGQIEEVTTANMEALQGIAGMRGVQITENTDYNTDAVIFQGRRIRSQALTGNDFKAQKYYETANNYIQQQVKIDESGNLETTPEGQQLLNTMARTFNYNPEDGTVTMPNGERGVLTPELLTAYMYDSYNIQEGTKLQEKKQKISVNLRNNVDVRVNTGGGIDPKAKLGYYTTQTESFTNWQASEVPKIQAQYDTPEKKNTAGYIEDVRKTLSNTWGIKQPGSGGEEYISYAINAKDISEMKNRTTNFNNLYITTPSGRLTLGPNMKGEVSGLEPAGGELTVGIFDPRQGRYRIVTNEELKSGAVNLDATVPLARYTYRLPKDDDEKKTVKGQVNTTEPGTIEKLRKMMADNKTDEIVELVPLNEKGVAQSLDSSYSTKGDYGQYRKEGGGDVGNNPTPTSPQSTIDNVFGK